MNRRWYWGCGSISEEDRRPRKSKTRFPLLRRSGFFLSRAGNHPILRRSSRTRTRPQTISRGGIKNYFLATILFAAIGLLSTQASGEDQGPENLGVCGDSGEWPPYIYFEREDGRKTDRAVGFSIDVISEVLDAAGVRYEISMRPWKRCLREVEDGMKVQVALDATYSEERAGKYHYSRPYYAVAPYYFYSKKYHPDGLDIWGPGDLKRHRISGVSGYNYSDFHLSKDDIDYFVKHQEVLVRHVHNDRSDLFPDWLEVFAGFSVVGMDFLADKNLGYAQVPGLGPTRFHMLFSRNEEGERLRRIVDKGIGKLEASGRLQKLLDKHKVRRRDVEE